MGGALGSQEETFRMKRYGVCWNGAIYWFGCHMKPSIGLDVAFELIR